MQDRVILAKDGRQDAELILEQKAPSLGAILKVCLNNSAADPSAWCSPQRPEAALQHMNAEKWLQEKDMHLVVPELPSRSEDGKSFIGWLVVTGESGRGETLAQALSNFPFGRVDISHLKTRETLQDLGALLELESYLGCIGGDRDDDHDSRQTAGQNQEKAVFPPRLEF